MENKTKHTPFMEELNGLYEELQGAIGKAKFFGKSLAPALEPIERVITFVAKVVIKVEELEERIHWLEEELSKSDESNHKIIEQ